MWNGRKKLAWGGSQTTGGDPERISAVAVGQHWSQKQRRMVAVYRDPPPKVTAVLGQWLAECFGPAGIQLAGLERQRTQRAGQERQRLAKAMDELQ